MYTPAHFAENDLDQLCSLIERNPFGMLVTAPGGSPFVSHLPFLLDRTQHRLYAHVARANPQWQHLAEGNEALAVFQGDHAFVSPHWYAQPGVPTWNYAVAHVRGTAIIMSDKAELAQLVSRMSQHYDSRGEAALPDTQKEAMLDRIVGFSLSLKGLSGKSKLSQNKSRTDQHQVSAALAQSPNPVERGMATLMTQKLGLNHE